MNAPELPIPENPQPAGQNVELDVEREVRFAVVMYGGVSLAIYINGVAQELLNLVRATAPRTADSHVPLLGKDNDDLKGPAGVYRKLGQYLRDGEDDLTWIDKARQENSGQENAPIRTRFIVDVISGTSAGGINGIFLAKALAKTQEMDGLKKLWLSEGDLSKLLNDSLSVEDLRDSGFAVQEPQNSLLNSQRMYCKLLEALAQMDEPGVTSVYSSDSTSAPSPLVNELDLFITTTDITGIPLPIVLSDRVVFERRYKNVFHFRYAKDKTGAPIRDDFRATNDPFLAFAARCTSSFPFAFEPMRLQDIKEVTERFPRYKGATLEENAKEWDHFFGEYLRYSLFDLNKAARGEEPDGTIPTGARDELRKAFQGRPFGDGGYLDNKPFSYATAMLMRRQADCSVQRKLIYVEPSPEHPELLTPSEKVPDFAENVRAAVLELPGKETIREDLDRLAERNQMVDRVTTFAREIDDDVISFPKEAFGYDAYCAADVGEMIGYYGLGYGAYHRLKVAEITSTLAELVARAKEHDPASDAGAAIRDLVAAWRRDKYKAMKPLGLRANKEPRQTENQFLVDFDLRYRLRRVIFLIRRLTELLQLDPEREGKVDARIKRLLRASLRNTAEKRSVADQQIVDEVDSWLERSQETELRPSDEVGIWLRCFCRELKRIKREQLSSSLAKVRATEEHLLSPSSERKKEEKEKKGKKKKDLKDWLDGLAIPWSEMEQILEREGKERSDMADKIFGQHRTEFEGITDAIIDHLEAEKLQPLQDVLSKRGSTIADRSHAFPASTVDPVVQQRYCEQGELAARRCLIYYDSNFVRYDMVTYPVQFGTGAGEANKVEVFRVSPEDAVAIINERKAGEDRRKLAGTTLMNFGAFLDQGWRKNDMLWGRLDGAERLICALLPLPDEVKKKDRETPDETARREKINGRRERRHSLIKEAHFAIFKEEIKDGDVKTVCNLIGTTLARCEPSSDDGRKLRSFVESVVGQKDLPEKMRSALYQCLDHPEKIWDYYNQEFAVNRELEAEGALRLIARATNITGKMLEGLAERYRFDPAKRTAVWIARLGSSFWNMVAVAVPSSLGNLFFRHWMGLLYLFSVVMIFAGILFQSPIKILGWELLGATVGVNLVVTLLGDFISGKWRRFIASRAVLIVLLVGLIGCGVYYVATTSKKFIQTNELAWASSIAGIILIVAGWAEWRRWWKLFRASPHASFNSWTLFKLTLATLGLSLLLGWIGPPGMVQLEFARDADAAWKLINFDTQTTRLYVQLGLDYLFIVAYTVTFAAYCLAAAKMFWQRSDAIRQAIKNDPKLKRRKKEILERRATVFDWFVAVGFAMAGFQCLAGLADAAENAGLLWFINDNEQELGLLIAYHCASVKFALIGLGALYSALGFVVGARNTPGRLFLYVFAAISVVVVLIAWGVLWCIPLHHPNAGICHILKLP